jgi:hypothetical protein
MAGIGIAQSDDDTTLPASENNPRDSGVTAAAVHEFAAQTHGAPVDSTLNL